MTIHQEFKDAIVELKSSLDTYTEQMTEIKSRMLAVEQRAVRGDGIPQTITSRGELGLKLKDSLSNDSAFAHLASWNQGTARAELGLSIRSALVNEASGSTENPGVIPSQPERVGIVGPVIAQPRLLNFLPVRQVNADSVEFIQLSTSDDVGYQLGEGADKAKLDFEGTKKRAHIVTIAGHTTASRQVLNDHSTLQQLVSGVMVQKLMNKLCYEIINGQGGNGDEQRIEGLMTQATTLQSYTTTTFADRVGEAVSAQASIGFQPNLIVVNPETWFAQIATAKTETEKSYLFGSPASPLPPALWNLPVVLEPSMAADSALIIDTSYVTLLDRERFSVLLSNSHGDNFVKNLITILAELRAGLEVLHDGAVVKVEAEVSSV